jgi:hypothetical protein
LNPNRNHGCVPSSGAFLPYRHCSAKTRGLFWLFMLKTPMPLRTSFVTAVCGTTVKSTLNMVTDCPNGGSAIVFGSATLCCTSRSPAHPELTDGQCHTSNNVAPVLRLT